MLIDRDRRLNNDVLPYSTQDNKSCTTKFVFACYPSRDSEQKAVAVQKKAAMRPSHCQPTFAINASRRLGCVWLSACLEALLGSPLPCCCPHDNLDGVRSFSAMSCASTRATLSSSLMLASDKLRSSSLGGTGKKILRSGAASATEQFQLMRCSSQPFLDAYSCERALLLGTAPTSVRLAANSLFPVIAGSVLVPRCLSPATRLFCRCSRTFLAAWDAREGRCYLRNSIGTLKPNSLYLGKIKKKEKSEEQE